MNGNEFLIVIGVFAFFAFMVKALSRTKTADGQEITEQEPQSETSVSDIIRADSITKNAKTVQAVAKAYDLAKGKNDPAFFELTPDQIEKIFNYFSGGAK